jgi:hypothetical protein
MLTPILMVVIAISLCGIAIIGYEFRTSASGTAERIAICMIVIGGLGVSEPVWLRLVPYSLLDSFELPNTLDATRLTAPDGRVFVVSNSIWRAQLYGPAGFEKGFPVRGVGKTSAAGVSAEGNLVICSASKEMITYSPRWS